MNRVLLIICIVCLVLGALAVLTSIGGLPAAFFGFLAAACYVGAHFPATP